MMSFFVNIHTYVRTDMSMFCIGKPRPRRGLTKHSTNRDETKTSVQNETDRAHAPTAERNIDNLCEHP